MLRGGDNGDNDDDGDGCLVAGLASPASLAGPTRYVECRLSDVIGGYRCPSCNADARIGNRKLFPLTSCAVGGMVTGVL